MGDFIASLSPEREADLFKVYNEWRRSRGLPEETAPAATPAPVATATPAAPEQRKESAADDFSALITEVAAEEEEEEAEEAALVHDALDGADEIVGTAPVPVEVEEEIEAAEPVADEPVPDDDAPEVATTTDGAADAKPEVATTLTVTDEPVAAAPDEPASKSVDFATVIRSLPKEADPALYSRIKDQFGEETKGMAQTALKEATAKHRATAAIRAFLAWLE